MNRHSKKKYAIAITGSIGSGKSTVAKKIADLGYQVIDADKIGHNLLNRPDIKDKLIQHFGGVIITNCLVDRKKLGSIVFEDQDKLQLLNQIVHCQIIEKIKKKIHDFKNFKTFRSNELIFFEVPLLFEVGIASLFDITVNVSCPKEKRINRLVDRDSLDKESIELRIDKQLPDQFKEEMADITIQNDCSLDCLYSKMLIVLKFLKYLTRNKCLK